MKFLSVKNSEDSNEYVKMPLKHNRLNVVTLEKMFPGLLGLFYRLNGELIAVKYVFVLIISFKLNFAFDYLF